ncbi:MAG: hypothetical protein ABSE82_15430, partial [Nitrososphaerales archaeon]
MTSDGNKSRRTALQKMILLPIGAAVAIVGAGSLAYYFAKPKHITIDIQYAGMSSVMQQSTETVKIQSPAKLSDLENILWKEHPVLQTMESMQVLVDGTGAYGDPDLRDGEQVVFIAL